MKRRAYILAALGIGAGGYALTRDDGDETDETAADSSESGGGEYEGTETDSNGTREETGNTGENGGENETAEGEPDASNDTEEIEERSPAEAAEEEGLEPEGNASDDTEDPEENTGSSGETRSAEDLDVEKEWRYNNDGTLDVGWRITNVSDTSISIVYVTFTVTGEDGSRLYEDSDGYRGLEAGDTWEDFYRIAAEDLSGTPAKVSLDVSAENRE